jgi:hypothetical protein
VCDPGDERASEGYGPEEDSRECQCGRDRLGEVHERATAQDADECLDREPDHREHEDRRTARPRKARRKMLA